MKYFLVAGEASGDMHAANLMRELQQQDPAAEFRFFGGDRMQAVGGTLLKHYRELAFMGLVAVLKNAGTLLRNLRFCKDEIAAWQPDALILVDYASFNLRIAEFVRKEVPATRIHFYISPKLWAWKEYRIKSFRKYIDHLYVILPFEPAFFAKHAFPATYVGNPCVDSIADVLNQLPDEDAFRKRYGLDERPVLALLPGSRSGEIHGNLPLMLQAAARFPAFQAVVAEAPGQRAAIYDAICPPGIVRVKDDTYSLLRMAHTAVVTSGTATLETALIGTPQVVPFAVKGGRLPNWFFNRFMHVRWFSLVNLIAGRQVVRELMGGDLTLKNLIQSLEPLLSETPQRAQVLEGYDEVRKILGPAGTAKRAAQAILNNQTQSNANRR